MYSCTDICRRLLLAPNVHIHVRIHIYAGLRKQRGERRKPAASVSMQERCKACSSKAKYPCSKTKPRTQTHADILTQTPKAIATSITNPAVKPPLNAGEAADCLLGVAEPEAELSLLLPLPPDEEVPVAEVPPCELVVTVAGAV